MASSSSSSKRLEDWTVVELSDFENDEAPGRLPVVQRPGVASRSPSLAFPSPTAVQPIDSSSKCSNGTTTSSSNAARDSGGSDGGLGGTTRDSLLNMAALEFEDASKSDLPSYAPRFQSRVGACDKLCPMLLTLNLLWQRRFLQLRPDGALYYFLRSSDYEQGLSSRGVIHLSDIRRDKHGLLSMQCHGAELTIGVHAKHRRNYRFRFASAAEARAWEGALRSHL